MQSPKNKLPRLTAAVSVLAVLVGSGYSVSRVRGLEAELQDMSDKLVTKEIEIVNAAGRKLCSVGGEAAGLVFFDSGGQAVLRLRGNDGANPLLEVLDDEEQPVLTIGRWHEGGGKLSIKGKNAGGGVFIGSDPDTGGQVRLFDSKNRIRASIFSGRWGGQIELQSPSDKTAVRIYSGAGEGVLELRDREGRLTRR